MHGRLKVKTTAEQQEAKRKEREKKLLLYTGATKKIFQKRTDGENDQEALNISGEILSANPDFYTLWNIRKEVLTHLINNEMSEDDLQSLQQTELHFLEQCLKVNPKSYGTWQHRCWVMDNLGTPNWNRELMLCNKFLEYDERNFHCWDYRRFVVARANVLPKDELAFTDQKIGTNFSNFSSWHYRTKLLPQVHPDENNQVGVQEEFLQKEFELVQNAFFTDPSDQSAWFYHRWLLGRGKRDLTIDLLYVNKQHNRIVITLSKPVQIGVDCTVTLKINQQTVEAAEWKSCSSTAYPCEVWTCNVGSYLTDNQCECLVSVAVDDNIRNVSVSETASEVWSKDLILPGTLFSLEMSAATNSVLTQELESCQQLAELEPDHKWTMLTIISLMKALDPLKYEQEMLEYFDTLIKVDPYRTNYYEDLRSKYLIENSIETLSPENRKIDLNGKNLTGIYHPEHLALCTHVDLSQNRISSLKNVNLIACVQELNLEGNQLSSVCDVEGLQFLQKINLKNNHIVEVDSLKSLTRCPQLLLVELGGNPVCDVSDFKRKMSELLPEVNWTV
ncbi:geranylgeranyl transferase type-2 subunit alpha-like [Tubulanus polymorphus]|uniref:geranylgeranyl transferase type-2 subunit alpha-like n=1 Tax=Tubulanus polymorphus TaxID=672921 RepID=UPI003DA2F9FB